ncbi:hypothetical protein RhiirA4_488197 [Rhizophagus irregularis]|uniref:Endonuclease/exonuclease/phosphatase domain-containing protein n=1 Tax=Rhizophagus irregularis TaxID=588596 RepID=A0A2I1HTG3_9GLOM|nr:hypothetical protein RhiirA4_488197 [Rhizophagus irregularis]
MVMALWDLILYFLDPVILGDFNIDEIAYSSHPLRYFKLLRLFSFQYFTNHQSHSYLTTGPDNTYFHENGSSRLDYIWTSPDLPTPGLVLSTCMAILAKFRLKQKNKLWHAFKRIVIGAAIDTLPTQHVSNVHHHSYSPKLTKLIIINKFLDRLLFRLTTSWPSHFTQIFQMTATLPKQLQDLASLLSDYTVPSYNTIPLL